MSDRLGDGPKLGEKRMQEWAQQNGVDRQQPFNIAAIFTVLLSLIVVGCGRQGIDVTDSDLSHDLNRPTNGDAASKWYEVKDADLRSVVYPMYSMFNGGGDIEVLPSSSPILKRVQHWLTILDKNLRKRHPEQMANVPAPRAQVIVQSDPNAFVMPIPVCVDVPVWIDTTQELTEANMASSLAFSAQGAVLAPWNGRICVDIEDDEAYIRQYVKDFNKRDLDCQLSLRDVDGTLTMVVGDECPKEPRVQLAAGGASVTLYPTASLVTIQSGILDIMDEEAFVSVLGHELGHYYMSHPDVSNPESYDYFYTSHVENHASKPAAEEEAAAYGKAAMGVKVANRRYRKVPGQKYRSELYLSMLGMVQTIAAKQECDAADEGDAAVVCNQACAKLADTTKSASFKQTMGKFPFAKLSDAGVKLYKAFENDVGACFKGVKVGDEGAEEGKAISASSFGYLLNIDRTIANLWKYTEIGDSLVDTLASAVSSLVRAEKELLSPLHEAHKRRLGWYTPEQEADDLAVEWMAQIGIKPQAVIDSEFALSKFIDSMYAEAGIERYPTELSTAECMQLYKNKWRDANGKYVFVAVGDYTDNHHSSCYRAWNADREIVAHKIQVAGVDSAPAGESWAEIQQAARDLLLPKEEDLSLWNILFGFQAEDGYQFSADWRDSVKSCQLFDGAKLK